MKENSIEEDIKIVENYLANSAMNEIDSNFFKNSGWETVDLEIPKSMQHILSDYKRVLKENEELKEDRKNNNEMIAFAQNELLNYMSGYEEGKKHKMTAVAQVVENQQYYIVRKQMEKYEEHIKRLQKENEEWQRAYQEEKDKQFDFINKISSNDSIPVQKVKDKIEELNRKINNGGKTYGRYGGCVVNSENIMKLQNQIEVLQELLEGRK